MKFRRKLRKQKRHVEDAALQADDSLNRLVFRRFENLYKVRRFVASWVVLVLFIGFGSIWQVRGLDKYYLEAVPSDGGVYREGMIGTFTNTNPLFAVTNVDASISRLVFSGLFTINPSGGLEPDLAEGLSIDQKGVTYTVSLRRDVVWHDGETFDADDVVFTYNTIKNADVNSPLFASWQGVKVSAVDPYTVQFTLPNILSSFKYSLVGGIVPEHILSQIEPNDLRTSTFNTVNPVGTGPFTYEKVEVIGGDPDRRQEKVTLKANPQYYNRGVAMDGIVIRTYRDESTMVKDFKRQQITGMVGLDTVPEDLPNDNSVQVFSTPLRTAAMVFFNMSDPLMQDAKLREALIKASDTDALRKSVNYQLVEVDSPFLKSHFSYDESRVQYGFDLEAAKKLLDEAGWVTAQDGYRYKDGTRLTVRIVSQSLAEYSTIIQRLQDQWRAVGVGLEAMLQPEESVQSSVIAGHDYQMLLYGVAIGPDPDVFAFWHSSQADPSLRTRLNLSEYMNDKADDSLEAGRTRLDEVLRTIKYQPFLDVWRTDVPAIALYQPRFLFITRGVLEHYETGQFNGPSDRFYSVARWQVHREKTVKK